MSSMSIFPNNSRQNWKTWWRQWHKNDTLHPPKNIFRGKVKLCFCFKRGGCKTPMFTLTKLPLSRRLQEALLLELGEILSEMGCRGRGGVAFQHDKTHPISLLFLFSLQHSTGRLRSLHNANQSEPLSQSD